MSKQHSQSQKQDIINRYFSGEGVTTLSDETGVSRSTIYSWVKLERELREKKAAEKEAVNFKSYSQLKEHAERLEGMLTILKTCGCAPHDPLAVKLKVSEQLYREDNYSVRMICEALDIARGTFYNHIFRNKRENSSHMKRREDLKILIQEIFDEFNGILGSPKIAAVLKSRGINVTKELVRQLMREMGLECLTKGAKKRYQIDQRKSKVDLLNQRFQVDKPNQIWSGDVTEIKIKDKKFYICIVMDLYARKIIAYTVGLSNSTQLTKRTIQKAVASRDYINGELIFHSDQGSNYTANAFRMYLRDVGIVHSFSEVKDPYDNSVIERFNKSLKDEELYIKRYRSEKEFRTEIDKYMKFYNEKRPHETLNYLTPNQKEERYYAGKK